MEIIHRPEQITIIYELHNDARRLYIGDRNVPEADRLPGRNGYSAAHWEGDTLVVETTKLVEQVDQRYPHSDRAQWSSDNLLTTSARGERVLVIGGWRCRTATCCHTTAQRKDGASVSKNSSAPPRGSEPNGRINGLFLCWNRFRLAYHRRRQRGVDAKT